MFCFVFRLAPEYREDEAVEEHQEPEPGHGLNPPEAGVGLLVPSLAQKDHPEHEESVHPDEDKVGLHDELGLRRAVDVGHATGGCFLDKRRASDVIPHLTRDHGEVVPPEVHEAANQSYQHQEAHGPGVV